MQKLFQYPARRAIYFIVAAVLALLAAKGWISEAQYESWTDLVEESLPLIGTAALFLAGVKTREGSDDPTTKEDLDKAYQEAFPVHHEPAPADYAAELRQTATSVVDTVRDGLDNALDSARAAYRDATTRE